MNKTELATDIKAQFERASAERKAAREKAIAEMTPEVAIGRIITAANILGDNTYWSAEYQMGLIAEWIGRKMEVPDLGAYLKKCHEEVKEVAQQNEEDEE